MLTAHLWTGLRTRKLFAFAFACALILPAKGQLLKRFGGLSGPEKCWVLRHPFRAGRAMRVSDRAQTVADSLRRAGVLTGTWTGDAPDAFRHAFWTATMTRAVGWRRARSLGRAHERGNYRDFRKGKLEDGEIQDAAASEMDAWNNARGIAIARANPLARERELMWRVLAALRDGELRVIRKDGAGRSLDAGGHVIPEADWRGKWENARCLAPSGN